MITNENVASPCPAGDTRNTKNHAPIYAENAENGNRKIAVADAVDSLRFIVENLDAAAHEATIAADSICNRNVVSGHYHVGRFEAHARAACGAFRDILGAPTDGDAR